MKKLKELQDLAHDKLLEARKIAYLVQQDDFVRVFKRMNYAERYMITAYVRQGAIENLKHDIRLTVYKDVDLESMTLEELKIRARCQGISCTQSKNKLLGVLLDDQRHSKVTRRDEATDISMSDIKEEV